jgi:replication factor A1
LTLVDDSAVEVNLTLWGEKATRAQTDYAGTPVVAFRRARVSDYGGKSLSGGDGIDINPDIPEAQHLRGWWQSSGSSAAAARSLSSTSYGGGGKMDSLKDRKDIASIKNESLGYTNPDKPDWLSFKATISFIKKDKEGGAWYPACANSGEPCKNRFKVTQTTDGQWYCDKCQGTYQNCIRRWIFSGVVEDGTSSTWVSFFNEQAETLFAGATADDVYNKTYSGEGHDQDAYDSYFARANFSECIFKCKVKNEMVNDESRVKTSVYSLHPVDYAKESLDLLAAIDKF